MINLLFFLIGCSNNQPKEKDFVGVWKSNDGAKIELYKNGTFKAKNIYYYNYDQNKKFKNKKFNFDGVWKLNFENKQGVKLDINSTKKFSDYGIVYTYIIDDNIFSHKLNMSFEIKGHGVLENKLPWELFVWIGDPDNMNKYVFLKQ